MSVFYRIDMFIYLTYVILSSPRGLSCEIFTPEYPVFLETILKSVFLTM